MSNVAEDKNLGVKKLQRKHLNMSIVIPTLNEEKLIEGFLKQFTPELRARLGAEVIVSDGGSTDNTLSLIKPLVDKWVVHAKPEAQTIAAGRNEGARLASGDVLVFLNADVMLPKDLEGFLYELIKRATPLGAATCRVLVAPEKAIWLDNVILGLCNGWFYFLNQIGIGMGRGECQAIATPVFQALGGYREDLVAGEDFDLFNRVARYARQHRTKGINFMWHWKIYEDPRRYRKIGYPKTLWLWLVNSLSVLFTGKARSKTWEPFR